MFQNVMKLTTMMVGDFKKTSNDEYTKRIPKSPTPGDIEKANKRKAENDKILNEADSKSECDTEDTETEEEITQKEPKRDFGKAVVKQEIDVPQNDNLENYAYLRSNKRSFFHHNHLGPNKKTKLVEKRVDIVSGQTQDEAAGAYEKQVSIKQEIDIQEYSSGKSSVNAHDSSSTDANSVDNNSYDKQQVTESTFGDAPDEEQLYIPLPRAELSQYNGSRSFPEQRNTRNIFPPLPSYFRYKPIHPLSRPPEIRDPRTDHDYKTCSKCKVRKHMRDFTKSQVSKKKDKRSCIQCQKNAALHCQSVEKNDEAVQIKVEICENKKDEHSTPTSDRDLNVQRCSIIKMEENQSTYPTDQNINIQNCSIVKNEEKLVISSLPQEDNKSIINQNLAMVASNREEYFKKLSNSQPQGAKKRCKICSKDLDNRFFTKSQLRRPASERTCSICKKFPPIS